MPSRNTTAGFFPLSLSPNSRLGLSALKDSTFHFSSGNGIYGADDTMDPAARLSSPTGPGPLVVEPVCRKSSETSLCRRRDVSGLEPDKTSRAAIDSDP